MTITLHDYARLVSELLRVQKGFFKGTPGSAERHAFLVEAKRLEAEVGRLTEAILTQQPTLFDREGFADGH